MVGYKIVFATTAGINRTFPVTVSSNPFFETSKEAAAFSSTITANAFFESSAVANAFARTVGDIALFATYGIKIVLPTVLPEDTSKTLKLKIGELDVASDFSTVTIVDATGEYNATTNPGGYNPEAASFDIDRAKRSEVKLWLAYRLWTSTEVPNTVFPSPADPDTIPWEYVLPIEGNGVLQLFMIAAPFGKSFGDLEALGNSVFEYATQQVEWFATAAPLPADQDIINCLNRARYAFLESVMCGNCDEGYLELYSKYVGALNAFEVGTEDSYKEGMALFDEIREECNKLDCNCNCSC